MGTGFQEKLWMPHLWKCSRQGWTDLRATWSSRMCPCLRQGSGNMVIFKVPSNPNHSMIPLYAMDKDWLPFKLIYMGYRKSLKQYSPQRVNFYRMIPWT